ncbi:MAG TPA: serine/threonine-protein kinase, partial [Polyangiales bacterium]
DRVRRTPKVLDFGISKVSDGDGLSLTQTGVTLGTPLYMSFEQLCGVRDIDVRTDVYAFGVILYEALTGRPPFEAETFTELIIKISNSRPTPPKALRADIPRSLDALIQSAMAKEREQRLASIDVMIRELERFATADQFRAQMTVDHGPMPKVVSPSQQPPLLLSEAADTGQADTPMNADVPAPAIPRRRDIAPWLVGAAVVASLLGAMMFFSSRDDDASRRGDAPRSAANPAPVEAPPPPSAAGAASLPVTTELPSGKAPPPSAAEVSHAEPKSGERSHPLGRDVHAPLHDPHPPELAPKPIAIKPAQVEAPRPVLIAPSKPNSATNLRAGRPRSQDF